MNISPKKYRMFSAAVLVGSLLATAPAFARPVGATVGIGTMGLGVNIGTPIIQNTLNLRFGFDRYGYSRSGTYDKSGTNVDYTGDMTLESIPVFLDWFPFHGTFRLTAGALDNRTNFDIDASPAPGSTVTINGNVYSASQVGSLTGTIDYGRKVAPYLGIGWGNLARVHHGFTFGVDLGVVFTGAPQVSLHASNPTGNAQLAADVTSTQQTAQTDVNSATWWPMIQMGGGYNF